MLRLCLLLENQYKFWIFSITDTKHRLFFNYLVDFGYYASWIRAEVFHNVVKLFMNHHIFSTPSLSWDIFSKIAILGQKTKK